MYGTIYDRLNQMLNKGHSPTEGVEAKAGKKEYEAKMGNPDEFIPRRSFEKPVGLSFTRCLGEANVRTIRVVGRTPSSNSGPPDPLVVDSTSRRGRRLADRGAAPPSATRKCVAV